MPASPASPLLPKHARPEKAVPAGSGRPGPCATRARDSLARGLAPRPGSRAPRPAWVPRGCSPCRQPPDNGAGRAPPPSPLNNRVLSRRGRPGGVGSAFLPAAPAPAPRLWGSQPSPLRSPDPPRARGDTGARCPSSGARCQSGSSFAACAGVGAGGATIQETHRKLLGAAPEINGGRRIRGVSCGGRSSASHGGVRGVGDPLSPRCPHSLHRHRHEAAASLQPREPLRDPAAPLPGLPGSPGQPGAHLPARRRRHLLPQGAQRETPRGEGRTRVPPAPHPCPPHARTSRRCRATC